MNVCQIGIEIHFFQGPKPDPGGLDELAEPIGFAMDQANSGEDFMGLTAEGFQHVPSLGEVLRFSKGAGAEGHDRIGSKNDLPGPPVGDFERLAFGIERTQLSSGESRVRQFLDLGGLDKKIQAGLGEKVASTRGRGGENEQKALSDVLSAGHTGSAADAVEPAL